MHRDWDSMPLVDGVKSCEHCSKKVYDFTGSKQDEFLKILAKNNNSICGRFSAEQMAVTHPILPAWKKWASAALVLVGINLFNNQADAQKPKIKQSINLPDSTIFVGMVNEKQAHYSARYDKQGTPDGGGDAFRSFLVKNLHYTKGMINGKVFVSFDINKNGTLDNFKILRGVSELNDKEVIRVMKLCPKWQPATYKGKPVVSTYTLPISFKK